MTRHIYRLEFMDGQVEEVRGVPTIKDGTVKFNEIITGDGSGIHTFPLVNVRRWDLVTP